jgi:DNA polymerase (family 10)
VANRVLKDLDIVVASVHSGFKQPRDAMTERLLAAIHNDYVNIIGHPTGRIIHKREPYQVDLPRVFEAAKAQGVFMEINAIPNRLDLSDIHCRTARDSGVMMTIGSDAHEQAHLAYLELGVATARRGWLTSDDIANTVPVQELMNALSK